MPRLLAAAAMAASIVLSLPPLPASADQSADFEVSGGHFFSQTNQTTLGARAGGFSVADANGIPFWTYFNDHGGPDVLGYPVSRRFMWDGYVCQATQRAILQWDPSTQKVQLANVFDSLSTIGKDQWLATTHVAPPAQMSDGEVQAGAQPVPFPLAAHFRFEWLYNDTSIFQRYFSAPDHYDIYGLPTSSVQDLGPYWAVRFQRVVMYHWKTRVPWADGGGVSIGLAGDLFKDMGFIPTDALQLEDSRSPDPGMNLPSTTLSPSMTHNLTVSTVPAVPTSSKPTTATAPESKPATAEPAPEPKAVVLASAPEIKPVTPAPAPEIKLVAPVPAPEIRPVAAAPAPAPRLITAATNLPVLVGVATWYGSDFQGRRMSNGVVYNMHNPTITAANAYPLGTWLRVSRLSTGRSILVRVTDRGAFRFPDIVDLSYSAFSLLGDPSEGVIRVRVEPVA